MKNSSFLAMQSISELVWLRMCECNPLLGPVTQNYIDSVDVAKLKDVKLARISVFEQVLIPMRTESRGCCDALLSELMELVQKLAQDVENDSYEGYIATHAAAWEVQGKIFVAIYENTPEWLAEEKTI